MLINKQGTSTLQKIPLDDLCATTLESPTVHSWGNIVLSAAVSKSSPTQKLCLENVVKLYLRVRSFSYTKDYISKYRIKGKTSKKGLRKDMKQSAATL
jgi:hypothetical protein